MGAGEGRCGQDRDEALTQWVAHGRGNSNENAGVVSVFTQKLCLGTPMESHL